MSLLSIELIIAKRVLRLTKMHNYFNVPPYTICPSCIIGFRHGTSGIFELWAFRKYIRLCVSNVHNKEYAPLKQNICIFCIFWKHFFWPIFDLIVASYMRVLIVLCTPGIQSYRVVIRVIFADTLFVSISRITVAKSL